MASKVIAAQRGLGNLHFPDFKPMTQLVDTSVQVIVHFNSMHSLNFANQPSGYEVKQQLSILEGIPVEFILLTINGHIVNDSAFVRPVGSEFVVMRATIAGGVAGGKGGFGAMLRSLAKQAGTKKTTDFGACRDLSGRRLRHVNDEKILQKWKEAKDKGEDFDVEEATASGIELWYLGTPSWADGIKTDYRKKFMKPRRKTKMCMDWIRARKDRKAPEGAPASWGCPRGRRCEFAHGDEELRGEMGEAKEQEKYQVKDAEANKKRDAYMAALSQQEEATVLSDMVLQGIRAQKKARLSKAGNNEIDTARDTMQMLPLDGMDFPDYDDFSAEQCVVIQKPAKILPPKKVEEQKPSSKKTVDTVTALPLAPKATHPIWLKTLSGKLIVTNEGELESESEFATVSVCCEISEGKWYYEVELLSAGLMQIGWANHLFLSGEGSLAEDGVGDDLHSWAYDGMRGKKWNGEDLNYGTDILAGREEKASSSSSIGKTKTKTANAEQETVELNSTSESTGSEGNKTCWRVGDIVGCLLDISLPGSNGPRASISYTVNGVNLGVAYSDIPLASVSSASSSNSSSNSSSDSKPFHFYPAMSLEDGEAVLLNIGQRPFSYPPPADTNEVCAAIVVPIEEPIGIIPESDPSSSAKKAPAAKRGRKSKKDLALEKELKEQAEADSIKKSLTAAIEPIIVAPPPRPYLPVIQAITDSIRESIPLDGRPDTSGLGGQVESASTVPAKNE